MKIIWVYLFCIYVIIDCSQEYASKSSPSNHPENNGQEFYPGYQGYNEFFLGQPQDGNLGFLPPNQGTPPLVIDPSMHPAGKHIAFDYQGLGPEGQFLPGDILPPASTPEPMPLHAHDGSFIPRSMPGTPFSQSLSQSLNHHHPEMSEAW